MNTCPYHLDHPSEAFREWKDLDRLGWSENLPPGTIDLALDALTTHNLIDIRHSILRC